jgi:hypothetical protein
MKSDDTADEKIGGDMGATHDLTNKDGDDIVKWPKTQQSA